MKWLPPIFVGILIGAALTFALGLFLDDAPKISEADWKTLQTRAQAQAVAIVQQQQEIAAKSAAIERLQKRVTAAAALATARPTATPAKSNALADLATLMDTPAMKKMMAAQQERIIEDAYADLIAQFHFTPEERAQFVRLLSARQAIDMEMGLKLMKLPPGERKKTVEDGKAAKAKADADIREFFNNEQDFATYTAYTEEQAQNYQMKALRPAMKFAGEPLTPEQEKSLSEIMRTEGKNASPATADTGLPTTPEATARMLDDEAQRQQRVTATAARVLSPAQLEVLRKSQAAQLQMMKASTEMSQAMFGR